MKWLDDLFDQPARTRYFVLALVVLGPLLLFYQFWYSPNAAEFTKTQDEVVKLDTELSSKKGKTNLRVRTEEEVRELEAKVHEAQARLPNQREIADLLSNIAASGRQAGLDITLFKQKPEVYFEFYAAVPVEMEMRGTYHDVAAFFDRVKRLNRIVNVVDIKLKKPHVDGERVWLEAGCTATTFRFLDEAERKLLEEQQKQKGKKPAEKQA